MKKFNAESTSGDVIINNISATECINASSVSGEIDLSNVKGKEIFANTISGGVMLTDTVASQKLKANSTSGEINLKRCDAKNIVLDTVSGEISGTLLSNKQFITETTSGTVNVPQSVSNEECRITTVSGDIYIKIADQ